MVAVRQAILDRPVAGGHVSPRACSPRERELAGHAGSLPAHGDRRACGKRRRVSTGTTRTQSLCVWIRPARLAVPALAIAAALMLLALVAGAAAPDEGTAAATELREAGYVVQSVERVIAPTFPGNGGEPVAVPDGARLYHLTYRVGLTARPKEAYRLVEGPFGGRWSFPDGH